MSTVAQTFTWSIVPKGKRIKIILPLDERLQPYLTSFTKKFGVEPKFIFLRQEMAKDWELDVVLGMDIVRLEKNYPIHSYTFARTREDFIVKKDKRWEI